jgi:ribosomal protein L40E
MAYLISMRRSLELLEIFIRKRITQPTSSNTAYTLRLRLALQDIAFDRNVVYARTLYAIAINEVKNLCIISKCGVQNPDDAKFCSGCGSQLGTGVVVSEKSPIYYVCRILETLCCCDN